MLTGYFDEITGWGVLRGIVFLPRVRVSIDVHFVVDTGADIASLSPALCRDAGLDPSQLELNATGFGAGGAFHEFREPAMLSFSGPEGRYLYLSSVSIPNLGLSDASPPSSSAAKSRTAGQ